MAKKEKFNNNTDYELITRIQPQGGILFKDEQYIKTGTGYVAILNVFEYPNDVNDFWLSNITNISNTIATVDVSSADVNAVKKNLNKSITEQNERRNAANDYGSIYSASERQKEMQNLYARLESMNEVVKIIRTRIFLFNRDKKALETTLEKIHTDLDTKGYKNAIFLNENTTEYKSLLQSSEEQDKENIFMCEGQGITTKILSAGNPYHFSMLVDPRGSFLGTTPCGGDVLFDFFHHSKTRNYYNALAIGTMGGGKSTLLKKLFKDRASRGDYIRAFDTAMEFKTLTEELGGRFIALDGSEGSINPLEILKTGDNENNNFSKHIKKVCTFYKFLKPSMTASEEEELKIVLREVYEEFNLLPGKHQITSLPPEKYPIWSDVHHHIEEKIKILTQGTYNAIQETLIVKEVAELSNIAKVIENITKTYGKILNTHSSIENVLDEQIVTFDISALKDMDDKIFDAVFFNALTLCWDNAVKNGTLMKARYEEGKINLDDIIHFLMILDESHRTINTSKVHALDQILVYEREARKYFAGIILASQSIRDYVPGKAEGEAFEKLKKIFELTQYKFIFRQDSGTLPLFDEVFKTTLTDTLKHRIPQLEQGSTILTIAADKSIELKVYLTEREKKMFKGGL